MRQRATRVNLASILLAALALLGFWAAPPASAETVTLYVYDYGFGTEDRQPVNPTIRVGDTISWVWIDDFHSVTSVAGIAESFDSGVQDVPFVFDYTFNVPGVYWYYCLPHGGDLGDGTASGMAGTITVLGPDAIPAPGDLSATAASPGQVDLAWTDNSQDESGFKIERFNVASETYEEIATVGADVTSFSDTDLAAETTYWYRVRAYNDAGDSDYSNEASATTPASVPAPVPAAPGELSAMAVSSSQIDLFWADNADNEEGFAIERWNGEAYEAIATVGADVTSFSDTDLAAETTYWYRVRAYNDAGDSDYSNEASADTAP